MGVLPLRHLRRHVRHKGRPVVVTVLYDGEHLVQLRVSKREVYRAIRRMKSHARSIRADDVFGVLVIG